MSLMQRFRLDGKTALVTGASRGIGLAIARVLGEAGARLVISSKTARPEVVASLKKAGYTVDYIQV
jgi:NAD(P)-dependent dehydrogenase (short-subunit alcohol dehydrogenase family)